MQHADYRIADIRLGRYDGRPTGREAFPPTQSTIILVSPNPSLFGAKPVTQSHAPHARFSIHSGGSAHEIGDRETTDAINLVRGIGHEERSIERPAVDPVPIGPERQQAESGLRVERIDSDRD